MNLIEIKSFETKFEDVHISISRLILSEFINSKGTKDLLPGTVGLWDSNTLNRHYKEGRNLTGDYAISFRNQGNHFDSIIMMNISFDVYSEIDSDGASVFAKFMQYLFEWLNQYIEENNILDTEGKERFVMPPFNLSKGDFPFFQG